MDIIQQKYQFNQKQPLGGYFEDAEIKNASYLALRKSDGLQVQLVIYKSNKPGQVVSYHKKITKFAEVRHPNLTPILECSCDPDTNSLFVVLEWTAGYSLKEFVGDGLLNWKTAYSVVRDILAGVSELHREGLVYSFINLENIEIVQGRGRLSFRYLIYKTYYLSPEVKENHQKSKESDLFSVGVCLFRMVFGTLPFKTKSADEYAKSVKAGTPRRIHIPNAHYPKLVPKELQDYVNLLCHLTPSERLRYSELHKKLDEMARVKEKPMMAQILGENYIALSVEVNSEDYVSGSVIELCKKKSKDQKRIFHLQMVRHNLTEISTYVDDIIVPFKNATNLHFANIHDFYVVQKDCLVIIYDYCSQGSLSDYSGMASFTSDMVDQVSTVLRSLLSQWRGQYRFLTNEEILLTQGKPVLKYPPFPTQNLRNKLKLSKKGNYFIAPEVEAGIQSLTADSWSVGAIEYWMRFGKMPEFNEKGQALISDKSQMTMEKSSELIELLCKKHRERKNLFPIENKPADRKISSDSYSSSESPRLSSRIKSIPSANHALKVTTVFEEEANEQEEELDQFQILSPHYETPQNAPPKMRKKAMSGAMVSKGGSQRDGKKQEEDLIDDLQGNPSLKISKPKEPRSKNRRKVEKPSLDIENGHNVEDPLAKEDISSSQLNLIAKAEDSPTKSVPKRFPTFSGSKDEKKSNHRDSVQKARDRQSTKFKKDSAYQKSQNSRRKTLESNLCVEPMNLEDDLMSGLAKEAWRISLIQKHWSKPIRVFAKGLIALLICIFVFYFSFFKINGELMKSRYDFGTELLYLRSDSVATTPTINFTAVTRTPLETYNSLNNQTLTYIRDVQRCVTNDYNNNSNVFEIISSGSFGTYQAFGFIIVIVNLILLCFSLAKLDLPKALSMTNFDDHFYVPLYNWFLVNLALTSLTSCTYLNYGGLFDLKLDPCLSRSSFPSLTFLMKNEPSSFMWRFVWVYIGILVAYVLILYLTIYPRTNLPRYAYICLVILYIAGIGVRALGSYSSSLQSILGACGELLSLLIGIPLLLIDIVASCRLRKIEKSTKESVGDRAEELEATEQNFNIE